MNSLITKALRKISYLKNDLLFSSGIKQPGMGNDSVRRILVYHGVVPGARMDINARFLSTGNFARHLAFFQDHFQVVPLEQYFENHTTAGKPVVSLTFDDGYLNNFSVVLPLLEQFRLPATFFITPVQNAGYNIMWADALDLFRLNGPEKFSFDGITFIKGRHEYKSSEGTLKQRLKNSGWDLKRRFLNIVLADRSFLDNPELYPYWKLMGEEDIKKLSASPFAEIGAHGLYHNCLSKIPLADAANEMSVSKKYVEDITGKPVKYLAYPDGDYNIHLVGEARKLGYKGQLLVDYLDPTHQSESDLQWRFGINPYISFNNQMECIINGKY